MRDPQKIVVTLFSNVKVSQSKKIIMKVFPYCHCLQPHSAASLQLPEGRRDRQQRPDAHGARLLHDRSHQQQRATGVNFTNVTYSARRSQKRKKTDGLTVFFGLLGSAHLKAAHKMLLESTPGVNLTNIL